MEKPSRWREPVGTGPFEAVPAQVTRRRSRHAQPWIAARDYRGRFTDVMERGLIPLLLGLGCREFVLLGILEGGLRLHHAVEDYLHDHPDARSIVPIPLTVRTRSSHGRGGFEFEIKEYPDHERVMKGRDVVIVDDIVDTGETIRHVAEFVKERFGRPIVLTSLVKTRSRVVPDFACFRVPDEMLAVGRGMDAGMGVGRSEPSVWDVADLIQERPWFRRHVTDDMLHFARSVGNTTLLTTLRHLLEANKWGDDAARMWELLARYEGVRTTAPSPPPLARINPRNFGLRKFGGL